MNRKVEKVAPTSDDKRVCGKIEESESRNSELQWPNGFLIFIRPRTRPLFKDGFFFDFHNLTTHPHKFLNNFNILLQITMEKNFEIKDSTVFLDCLCFRVNLLFGVVVR